MEFTSVVGSTFPAWQNQLKARQAHQNQQKLLQKLKSRQLNPFFFLSEKWWTDNTFSAVSVGLIPRVVRVAFSWEVFVSLDVDSTPFFFLNVFDVSVFR